MATAATFLPAEPGLAPRPEGRPGTASRALEWLWRHGHATRPTLDPDALIAAARARTGLDDLGDPAVWRASLETLTHGLERDARLSPLGRTIAHGQLGGILRDRLHAHALWRQHPEIAEIPIKAPVVVLGHMRSGTTRMQRLLACDPRLGFTRFYESWNPIPLSATIDDRPIRAALGLFVARTLNPAFDAIHPTAVAAPDEEIGLHSLSLFGTAFEAQWRVPGFVAHGEAMDATPVYREFRHLLQTLAWLRGERQPRPWILKVPQFTQDLPALLAAFPDARLVCLHRDPAALLGSSASLVRNQMAMQSDAVDPRWIGAEWLRKLALRQRRTVAARAVADVPQIDVDYAAMDADPLGEMGRVYRWLGLPLEAPLAARMTRLLARPRGRAHRYDLADYGIAAADLAVLERSGFPARAAPSWGLQAT